MSAPTATASVAVPCDPATAFRIFTADIGAWWKRGTRYWNDAERGRELRFEPYVGGRLLEVHDPGTGAGFEIGRVLAWEPGKRVAFTWRQEDWTAAEFTDVEVRFAATGNGTQVTVEHGGWERIASAVPGLSEGYGQGWHELLGFFARATEAR